MAETTAAQEAPLWQRRPERIQTMIDTIFSMFAIHGPPKNYRHLGTSNVYHWRTARHTNSLDLVGQLERNLERPLDVLDVGTGYGSFIKGLLDDGHNPVGISANDYRDLEVDGSRIPDEHYIVGDVHSLHDLVHLDRTFDLVVTRWTLRHLVDRLSVLEQMADRVRAGGLMVFDSFMWDPDARRNVGFGVIAAELVDSGFELVDIAQTPRIIDRDKYASAIDSVWQRVDDSRPVRFPIDYDTYGVEAESMQSFRYARIVQ